MVIFSSTYPKIRGCQYTEENLGITNKNKIIKNENELLKDYSLVFHLKSVQFMILIIIL